MNTVPGSPFDSASDFDTAARAESQRLNIPLPRMSSLPLSPYAATPILVWSDRSKPGQIEYASATPSPISHCLLGLAVEIIYTTVGAHVADTTFVPKSGPNKGEKVTRPGTFTYWSTPDEDGKIPSRIAELEKRRLAAAHGKPHRGPHPIIVDTPSTLNRLVEALRDLDDPMGSIAARTLQVGASLTYCPEVFVLTRATALRYYVPSNLPLNSMATWRAAFQFSQVSPADDMMAVWDRLITTNGLGTGNQVEKLLRREAQSALRTAAIASGTAAIRVNSHCESATAAFSALETTDPSLRERALAAGDLITTVPHEAPTEHDAVLTMTSNVLRMKRRDRITLHVGPSGREIAAAIRDVRIDPATSQVRLEVGPAVAKKRTKQGEVVATEWVWSGPEHVALGRAWDDQGEVSITKTVMGSFAGSFKERRWIRSTARERVQRSMPVDVAIASRS